MSRRSRVFGRDYRTAALALLSFCTGLLISPVEAQTQIAATPSEYSFGTVQEGEVVRTSFTIKNGSGRTASIQGVQTSCACTAVLAAPNIKITPGGEQNIPVEFSTKGFSGNKVKTVRVFLDDPQKSSVLFTLKGTVRPRIALEPARVFFGAVPFGESREQKVSIKLPAGVRVTGVSSRDANLSAAIAQGTVLIVTLLPQATQDAQAVATRHHDVEHQRVVGHRRGHFPRFIAIADGVHLNALLLQPLLGKGKQFGLVFDEENAHVADDAARCPLVHRHLLK